MRKILLPHKRGKSRFSPERQRPIQPAIILQCCIALALLPSTNGLLAKKKVGGFYFFGKEHDMERTIEKIEDYESNPPGYIITKYTMDKMLREHKCDELIALYNVYCYVAMWQKTNRIKATTNYISNQRCLGWSEKKVQRVKKRLKELGLIADVVVRERGKITGHFIQIKYVLYSDVLSYFATPSFSSGVTKIRDKCLMTNNRNACGSDKELLRNSYHRDREAGRGLKGEFSLLGKDKDWKIRWGAKIQNKLKIQAVKGKAHFRVSPVTWGKKIDYIIQKVGVTKENFIKVMTWYLQDTTLKQKYTPKIRRPEDLVTKWSGILDAYNKDKNEKLLASRNPDDQGVWTETIKNPDGTWTSIIHYPENFHDNL